MKGKLIIIEAGDGCGKATQTRALLARLQQEGRRVHKVEFPDYGSESSALIRLYLSGAFGKPGAGCQCICSFDFFAVDRYASCWE